MADMPEETESTEFVIPKESLAGYECKPGDKIVLEVTDMDDDSVSVKFVEKEKADEKEPSITDDPELDAAFSKGM